MHTNTAPSRAAGSFPRRGDLDVEFRSSRAAVARIAAATAAAAAAAAWLLTAVFHLSQDAVILTVITVAFCASWAITNRRPPADSARHTVTVVPVKVRTQRL